MNIRKQLVRSKKGMEMRKIDLNKLLKHINSGDKKLNIHECLWEVYSSKCNFEKTRAGKDLNKASPTVILDRKDYEV